VEWVRLVQSESFQMCANAVTKSVHKNENLRTIVATMHLRLTNLKSSYIFWSNQFFGRFGSLRLMIDDFSPKFLGLLVRTAEAEN
jgi:hypothetical protein